VSCCCCRDELKIFAGEVIRFGNHCRDPQWHQLDRVFDRLGLTIEDSRQSKEQADVIMQNLMTLAENTAVRNKMQKPHHHHHHHACLLLQIKLHKNSLCVCVCVHISLSLSLSHSLYTKMAMNELCRAAVLKQWTLSCALFVSTQGIYHMYTCWGGDMNGVHGRSCTMKCMLLTDSRWI
jgi:hypothetical protein